MQHAPDLHTYALHVSGSNFLWLVVAVVLMRLIVVASVRQSRSDALF